MSGSRRTGAALALALLVLALSAGCAGEEDGRAEADSRFECIQEAQAQAEWEVVSRYLGRGKLGTPREIEREISALPSPGFEPSSFLTSRGRLVRLGRMTDDQRATFGTWKNTDPVQDVIHDAEERETMLAREEARATCPGG